MRVYLCDKKTLTPPDRAAENMPDPVAWPLQAAEYRKKHATEISDMKTAILNGLNRIATQRRSG